MKTETHGYVSGIICKMEYDTCQAVNVTLWAGDRLRTLIEMIEDRLNCADLPPLNMEYVADDLATIRKKMIEGAKSIADKRTHPMKAIDRINELENAI